MGAVEGRGRNQELGVYEKRLFYDISGTNSTLSINRGVLEEKQ